MITKVTGYRNTTGTLYKRYVTDCTPSSYINGFPNIKNYTLVIGSGNLRGTACLYFSSFLPNSARTKRFDVTGSLFSVDVDNYTNLEADGDNHITQMTIGFTASSSIYFKY